MLLLSDTNGLDGTAKIRVTLKPAVTLYIGEVGVTTHVSKFLASHAAVLIISEFGKKQWNRSKTWLQSASAQFARSCMFEQRPFFHAVTFIVGIVTPTCWMHPKSVDK